VKSTLLEGLRSPATCANAGPHSGGCEIHGKDGVAGSIPAGGSTPNQQDRPGPAPGLLHARSASNRHLPENAVRSRQNTLRGTRVGWASTNLLSDADDNHQATLDGHDDPGGHLRGGVAVVGTHGAAQVLGAAGAGLVAHELIDHPGRDAGVLQPGREAVPEVMGAAEIDRVQERVSGRGQG
jgi:hypothetical protein